MRSYEGSAPLVKLGWLAWAAFQKKLKRNQRKGSKPRCHWLTHGTSSQVASELTALTEPLGSVSADDCWMPAGLDQVDEVQLHWATRLLRLQDREALGDWWLSVRSDDSRTPSWDIASTCTVRGTRGCSKWRQRRTPELKAGDRVDGSPPPSTNCQENRGI